MHGLGFVLVVAANELADPGGAAAHGVLRVEALREHPQHLPVHALDRTRGTAVAAQELFIRQVSGELESTSHAAPPAGERPSGDTHPSLHCLFTRTWSEARCGSA